MKSNLKLLYTFLFIALSFSVLVSVVMAEERVGFVSTPVWFSGTPTAGVPVDIHTVVYNGRDGVLSATVQFLDGKAILGSVPVSVADKTATHVKLRWVPTPGTHSVSVEILKASIKQNNVTSVIIPDSNDVEPLAINISPKEPVKEPEAAPASTSATTSTPGTQSNAALEDFSSTTSESFAEGLLGTATTTMGEFLKSIEKFFSEKQTSKSTSTPPVSTSASEQKPVEVPAQTTTVSSDTTPTVATKVFGAVDTFRASLAAGAKKASVEAETTVAKSNTEMQAQKDARVEKKLNIDAQDTATPTVQDSADTLGTGTGSQVALYTYKSLAFILDTPIVFYSLVGVIALFVLSAVFNKFREDN